MNENKIHVNVDKYEKDYQTRQCGKNIKIISVIIRHMIYQKSVSHIFVCRKQCTALAVYPYAVSRLIKNSGCAFYKCVDVTNLCSYDLS